LLNHLYREVNGVYGFIGVSGSTSFADIGTSPDALDTPPFVRNPFGGAGNFPSTVAYHQQRRIYANTGNAPETTFASRTGFFDNSTLSHCYYPESALRLCPTMN